MSQPSEFKPPRFVLPPHINAEPHRRLMAKLATMTSDEFFETVVEAGIYTPDGQLTEHYRAEPGETNGSVRQR